MDGSRPAKRVFDRFIGVDSTVPHSSCRHATPRHATLYVCVCGRFLDPHVRPGWRYGDMAIWRYGDMAIWRYGLDDVSTYGDMAICEGHDMWVTICRVELFFKPRVFPVRFGTIVAMCGIAQMCDIAHALIVPRIDSNAIRCVVVRFTE